MGKSLKSPGSPRVALAASLVISAAMVYAQGREPQHPNAAPAAPPAASPRPGPGRPWRACRGDRHGGPNSWRPARRWTRTPSSCSYPPASPTRIGCRSTPSGPPGPSARCSRTSRPSTALPAGSPQWHPNGLAIDVMIPNPIPRKESIWQPDRRLRLGQRQALGCYVIWRRGLLSRIGAPY